MYNILFLFVIFVGVVEFRIPGLNYWDEVMLMAVPLYYVIQKRKLQILQKEIVYYTLYFL